MTNTKKYQENRRGITIRLANRGDMTPSESFSQEQMAELEALLPDVSTSRIVQMALLHYSKVLPDLIIKEQEEKLQTLRGIKERLENGGNRG